MKTVEQSERLVEEISAYLYMMTCQLGGDGGLGSHAGYRNHTEHVNSLPRSKLGLRDSIHILFRFADEEKRG